MHPGASQCSYSTKTTFKPLKDQIPTICLVDDDASVLRATGRLIRSAGWQVAAFDNPQAFLNYAEAHRPRVAVLDVCMPGMDGFEVQARLRTLSPTTQVIFLTGTDDRLAREKVRNAGAFAFFSKPATEDELLTAIQSVLSAVCR